jgi:glutaconate CoA-transferase subunit A
MGVPYVPVLGLVGTDLLARRDDMVLAPDPFGEGKVTVVAKALRPDVALFHAHKADPHGNVSFGYPVDAVIIAEAAQHVVVTVEEIVDRLEEREAQGAFLPGILVDAVAHAPFGAHPGGLVGRYSPDRAGMEAYVAAARVDRSFSDYLQAHVFDCEDEAAYRERFVPQHASGVGHGV